MSRRQKLLYCENCRHGTSYDPELVERNPAWKHICGNCGKEIKALTVFEQNEIVSSIRKGSADGVKRSRDQEKRSAKRNRARAVSGSGSSSRAKGDIRDQGRLYGECKHTTNKTFTLKLDHLLKAEREAKVGEHVLFEVEFQGVHPHKRYVVLSDDVYQTLVAESEE